MRRLPPLVVVLAALLAPAAASARPHVLSAYLWKGNGQIHLNFKTDRALPEKIGYPQTTITPSGTTYTVSDSLHCYQVDITQPARPGDKVRVKIGQDGALFNRRLEVVRRQRGYQRGGLLGCTQDPKANRVLFNLYPSPAVEPVRYFFTANAGPYLDRLRWTGWGTDRATATAVFVSDCASCGPKVRKRTTVVLNRTITCAPWGIRTKAYTGYAIVYDTNRRPVRQDIGDSNYC
jgi:hypothetical protein